MTIAGTICIYSNLNITLESQATFSSLEALTAGRRYSRTKARALFGMDDLSRAMAGIEYRHSKVLLDSRPRVKTAMK